MGFFRTIQYSIKIFTIQLNKLLCYALKRSRHNSEEISIWFRLNKITLASRKKDKINQSNVGLLNDCNDKGFSDAEGARQRHSQIKALVHASTWSIYAFAPLK